jgi:integrase
LIEANPLDGVQMASVPQQAPVFFKPDDFRRLVECIKEGWFREVVLFAVLTGMRKGEILNLRWSDVDLQRRVLNIETSASFKTKQGKRRTIPLNDSAAYLLRNREGKSPSEFVFILNDKPLNAGWVTHLFKRYVRKAGLADERLHYHSLRHTFASWLVQGGASLYEVQRLLGHSSAKVTEMYSHLQPDQMHETVNKILIHLN